MNPVDDDDLDDSDLGQEDSGDHSLEKRSTATIRKGLLWQQRDKFFSQWKERYFILTPDYLQCFKKGTSRITEMGEFIYKIKLCELEDAELLDRRGYLVLCFTLQKEGKVYLRKTEGIRDWFNALKESMEESKKRWNDRTSKNFWSSKQLTDSSSIEKWLQARKKIGVQYSYLNNDVKSKSDVSVSNDVSKDDKPLTTKPAKSEITLDELSDLYRNEEEEERRKSSILTSASSTTNVTSSSSTTTNIVQLRASRDDLSVLRSQQQNNGNAKQKKINRLSLMTDLELPDLGHDLISSDLERGIFKVRGLDNESSDSGNNSMNTNGSVASSNSSHSNHSNPREPRERLETHLESDQDQEGAENAREESKLKAVKRRVREENGRKYFGGSRRPSSHVINGLQVTHV